MEQDLSFDNNNNDEVAPNLHSKIRHVSSIAIMYNYV